jgi:hypothetical protein
MHFSVASDVVGGLYSIGQLAGTSIDGTWWYEFRAEVDARFSLASQIREVVVSGSPPIMATIKNVVVQASVAGSLALLVAIRSSIECCPIGSGWQRDVRQMTCLLCS